MVHHDHAAMKRQGHRDHEAKVHKLSGHHSDVAQDKKLIERAIHEHEKHDHPGSPLTKLKLSTGGHVKGEASRHRLDHKGSHRKGMATGGAAMEKKPHSKKEGKGAKGKSGNHVNIIVAPGAGGPHGAPMPMAAPRPPVVAPPPRPPMAPPTAGMGPRPPMGPMVGAGVPGMRAAGGRITNLEKGGGAGGEGRLEKIKKYGKKAVGVENKGETFDAEDKGSTADYENKGTKKRRSGGGC